MVGKITTVLTRREAEAYRAQGLHQEAIDLYARLLETCPNMDPALKASIQNQIDGLSEEKRDFSDHRRQPLNAEEIRRIRDGWGDQATGQEIQVCAQAFYQIGAYSDALQEYGRLLEREVDSKALADAVAACLVRGYPPGELTDVVSRLCDRSFSKPNTALAFKLHLAHPLSGHTAHALAYYRYLKAQAGAPVDAVKRLDDAIARLEKKAAPPNPSPAGQDVAAAQPPQRWGGRVKALFLRKKS